MCNMDGNLKVVIDKKKGASKINEIIKMEALRNKKREREREIGKGKSYERSTDPDYPAYIF